MIEACLSVYTKSVVTVPNLSANVWIDGVEKTVIKVTIVADPHASDNY